MTLHVEDGSKKHLDGISEIEKECFSMPWSREVLHSFMEGQGRHCFVALQENRIVGYLYLMYVLDEAHVSNTAVSPEFRRQGVAESLLSAAIDWAKEQAMVYLMLEVRPSNYPAVGLYRKYGFEDAGIRPNYYDEPKEDALLMTKILLEEK